MANYGVDIAIRRGDDLDRKMIEWIKERCAVENELQGTSDVPCADGKVVKVLDLGCGGGGQSVRLVEAGASVLGVDVGDYNEEFKKLREEWGFSVEKLKFVQGDITRLGEVPGEEELRGFDVVCFQRTLHYVRYDIALSVLAELRKRMKEGRRLFVAVTGVESDIGREYADADKVVEDRFCRLSGAEAETFNISEPVCLYTPEEFMVLLQESGWEIEECWTSAFGNIKAICR